MTSKELREKYIEFFKSKGHRVIPSASLIPENDPSVLFTTAGMHPLVPFLAGEKHPAGKRLVDYQKCIRTGDIDAVGDQWHLTFFEMLGNWSLGDYFKREALEWSWEFLTASKWLAIPKERLAVTVFGGDKDAPFDEEAYEIWKKLGLPENKIYKYGKKENWWGPAGETGPCGPDSEMFYITDKEPCGANCQPSCSCGRYVEIWNDVFMQYNKIAEGKYEPLKQKNIDTGMGVERVVAVLNGYQDNYQELLKPLVNKVEELSGKRYAVDQEITKSMRIIVDHLRAATFIMGDDLGIAPSNLGQGYVVRKLIRRAIRHGRMIGIQQNFTQQIALAVIKTMSDVYPELERNKKFVLDGLNSEEEKFMLTLQKGLKIFKENIKKLAAAKNKNKKNINGDLSFNLYQTYGFPLELIKELAHEQGFEVDEDAFKQKFKQHQQLSRAASAGKFKGGLGSHSEMAIKYHTATHLLHAALRQVLGPHVAQKGSNITDERLRFDFSHNEKLTTEEKKKVEEIVNEQIAKDLPVRWQEMTLKEAQAKGAIGLFAHKYGERVKVYTIGNEKYPFSREICGGPHVKSTGTLGHFRIKKEESNSAGVRRIKAVLE